MKMMEERKHEIQRAGGYLGAASNCKGSFDLCRQMVALTGK